ncbi:glutaredoxin family protein [Lentibacillus lipolyticus]|nr:glutaredoxin family protein [Lentibacillus lipolyticus]
MTSQSVVVYISENSSYCKELLSQLDYWQINYETKNVTKNRKYMQELQEDGIFGTPATVVNDHVILGSQINKIRHELGMMQHYSHGGMANYW